MNETPNGMKKFGPSGETVYLLARDKMTGAELPLIMMGVSMAGSAMSAGGGIMAGEHSMMLTTTMLMWQGRKESMRKQRQGNVLKS